MQVNTLEIRYATFKNFKKVYDRLVSNYPELEDSITYSLDSDNISLRLFGKTINISYYKKGYEKVTPPPEDNPRAGSTYEGPRYEALTEDEIIVIVNNAFIANL